MTDQTAETIRAIKAELRSAMNGITSSAIRQSGMDYKLVFGVELPRLRQIAAEFMPSASPAEVSQARSLALALWSENIRECKMLAILLFPPADFDADMADLWMSNLQPQQAELASLLAMELLCRMPQAADRSFLWMADERLPYQLCGYLTLTRLLMQGAQLSPDAEAEYLDQAAATIATSYLPLRKAVVNSLLRFAESSEEAESKVSCLLGQL
ncbi:MAG: DNA alkylation repair protein [Bacteroidaceae bacterium]|nr:DNA alkylation repair protein [Bacteroidaceae bacterium]